MHDDLRDAMRRVEPPDGFADRVLQRVNRLQPPEPAAPKPAYLLGWPAKARLAIAATVVIGVASGIWYRAEERRKQEGEDAKRQVLLSLNIAGSKLREVAMKINHEQER